MHPSSILARLGPRPIQASGSSREDAIAAQRAAYRAALLRGIFDPCVPSAGGGERLRLVSIFYRALGGAASQGCLPDLSALLHEHQAGVPESSCAAGPPESLSFLYRDPEGVLALRTVAVIGVRFGSTPHHPGPQLLVRALDLDDGAEREFVASMMSDPASADPPIRATGDGS